MAATLLAHVARSAWQATKMAKMVLYARQAFLRAVCCVLLVGSLSPAHWQSFSECLLTSVQWLNLPLNSWTPTTAKMNCVGRREREAEKVKILATLPVE